MPEPARVETRSVGHALAHEAGASPHPGSALADGVARLARTGSIAELLPVLATSALEVSGMMRAIVLVADRRGATDSATARDPQGLLDAPLLRDVRKSVGRRGLVDALMSAVRPVWKFSEELVVLHEPWLENHAVRAVLGVPVPIRSGSATLLLTSGSALQPDRATVAAVEQLAEVAGSLIDATRRLEDERRGRRSAELILRELETIGSGADTSQVLRRATEALKRTTDDDTVAGALVVDGRLGSVEAQGDQLHVTTVLRRAQGRLATSAAMQVDLHGPGWDTISALGIARLLVVPIMRSGTMGDVERIGWIVAYSGSGRRYDTDELRVADVVARQASMALANVARLQAERDALRRLEELDRLKSGFVASLSHGLRTPLTALVGYSELLAERAADDPSLAFAEDMRREAAHLHTLIGNLLDASRLEAGMLHLNPRPIDGIAVVREAIEAASHASPYRRIELRAGLDRFAMVADAERMRQVLAILFDNAMRYSNGGDEPVEVTAFASAEFGPAGTLQNGIRVHVDDHGPGIAPEDRERIFERFARGREDIEGTGIGLFLARELVRAHGGSILVETAQGGGSRFSVWLPQEPT